MRKKIWKKLGLITMSALAFSSTAIVAVSCANKGAPGVFRFFNPTDFLKDNNSPLNPSFNNSPISTFAGSVVYNLVTYETTTDTSNDLEGTSKFKDNLMLEGASQIEIFKDESQMKAYDQMVKEGRQKETKPGQTGPYTFKAGSPLAEQANYDEAISSGTVYRFKINTENKWVDNNGKVMGSLSSKDFERGIESYSLSSSLGYNRNGYFLTLMGLNVDKTVSYKTTDNNYAKVTSPEYDINKYANQNDDIFTVYIDTPYPYTLDLLSKEYFAAIPHNNDKVKNINISEGSPIKYTYDDDTKKYKLDTTNTDFNKIYGSGDITNFHKGVWYASSYYISHFTSTQIIFEINPIYFEHIGKNLQNGKEEKIKTIIASFGSGTIDTYYELFKSGQNDYLASVPATKKSEAVKLFKDDGLELFKNSKIPQSNYITFTPKAYIFDGTSFVPNKYVSGKDVANFINNWSSKDSLIVRAGIAGLINHRALSSINLPSSGDFQLSSVPYGNFEGYYEQVSKEGSTFLGGLPRKYSDYLGKTESNNSGKSKSNNSQEQEQEYIFSTGFTLPVYTYKSEGITIEEVKVDQDVFVKSLNNLGFSASKPLNINAKFGEGSFTSNYNNYLNQLKSSLSKLSNGIIQFNVNGRNGAKPTFREWYSEQSSDIGFSYWSPDYNGVGTWLEASNLLGTLNYNGQSYEGYADSNSHNSWNTYFQAMVTAVKLSNATWQNGTSGSKGNYVIGNSVKTTDPYSKDNKIQGAFNKETLKGFGIDITKIEKSKVTGNDILPTDNPGTIYAKTALEFINLLIEHDAIDQTKFDEYVKNPSLLNTKDNPSKPDDVIIGSNALKKGGSGLFTKYLGVFAGQSDIKALWATTVNDSDYSYIPRSESGLNELTFALVNQNYTVRVSGVASPNFRDYGWNK